MARNGISDDPFGWAFSHKAVPYYLVKLYVLPGAVVAIMALVGLIVKWPRKTTAEKPAILWSLMIALLFSVVFVAMVIPAGYEPRYLLPALPAIVMFAVAGADWIRRQLRQRNLSPQLAEWLDSAFLWFCS